MTIVKSMRRDMFRTDEPVSAVVCLNLADFSPIASEHLWHFRGVEGILLCIFRFCVEIDAICDVGT